MDQKGGEKNEEEHITPDEPAADINAFLGRTAGVWRGNKL